MTIAQVESSCCLIFHIGYSSCPALSVGLSLSRTLCRLVTQSKMAEDFFPIDQISLFESSAASSESSSGFPKTYENQPHLLERLEYDPVSQMNGYACQEATPYLHFGGPCNIQSFPQILSSHDFCTETTASTAPSLLVQEPFQFPNTSCPASQTAILGPSILEKFRDSGYSIASDIQWLHSPMSDNNGATGLAGSESDSSASERLDISREIIPALSPSPSREISPEIRPANSRLPCQKHGYSKRINQANHQCPVCSQYFRRRDNIKPHVRSQHPVEFKVRYGTTGSASKPSPVLSTTNHLSTHTETPPTQCLHSNEIMPTKVSSQSELIYQTPGLSGETTVPQKRPHDGDSPKDTCVLNGSEERTATRLRIAGGDQGDSLACPFQKRDPFKHRRCFGVVLQRIKDVKQHIYRCHSNPEYYCATCYQIFDTATSRDDHSRQRGCQTLDHPSLEHFIGINEDQRKKLNEKSLRTLSEEEQWYKIWEVIFPDAKQPSSAYQGDCLRELVPVLRQKWACHGSKIMVHASGVDVARLSCAMDAFFKYLEGETAVSFSDMSNGRSPASVAL